MEVRLERFEIDLVDPLATADGEIESRTGFLFRVERPGEPRDAPRDGAPAAHSSAGGRIGVGEATPLPGWTESVAECRAALERAAYRLHLGGGPSLAMSACRDAPAARHAVALAFADLKTRQSGVSLARHLGATPPGSGWGREAGTHDETVDGTGTEDEVVGRTGDEAEPVDGAGEVDPTGNGSGDEDATVVGAGDEDATVDGSGDEDAPAGTTDDWRLPCNATIGDGSPTATADAARDAVAAGFDCLKVKVGARAPDVDRARLRAVREAVGPDVSLRVDANGAWSASTAEAAGAWLRECDVDLVEQPLPADELEAIAALDLGPVGVAADESLAVAGRDAVLAADGLDAVVVKPLALGGPRRAVRFGHHARAAGLDVIVTTTVDAVVARTAAVHVAAALAPLPHCGLATADRLASDLAPDPAPVVDGAVRVPAGPGTGVDVAQLGDCTGVDLDRLDYVPGDADTDLDRRDEG